MLFASGARSFSHIIKLLHRSQRYPFIPPQVLPSLAADGQQPRDRDVDFSCCMMASMDPLHIGWRLRNLSITPTKQLCIGSFAINFNWLFRKHKGSGAILYADINHKDKQNHDAVMRRFDFQASQVP